jgi:hypothetical protein
LGIGELLDRAVTLFVKNAWLFIALAAIVYVPVAIAQLSLGDFWIWYMSQFSKVIAQPGNTAAALALDRELLSRAGPAGMLTFVVWVAAGPLVTAAMAYVTGRLLSGAPATFGDALRFALTRWGRVVLFSILWFVTFVALVFAVTIVLGIATVALSALLRNAAVAIVLVFGIFFVMMLGTILASVSVGVGFMAAILENAGVIAAFASGIARTVNRQMFWRSVLVGLVIFAIAIGFSIIGALAGFGLLSSLKSGVPLVLINTAVSMVQFGFFIVFMALFYHDLRVRREGVDLESMAARLSANA